MKCSARGGAHRWRLDGTCRTCDETRCRAVRADDTHCALAQPCPVHVAIWDNPETLGHFAIKLRKQLVEQAICDRIDAARAARRDVSRR